MTNEKWNWRNRGNTSPDTIYGLAVIGAATYYIQHATSFGAGVYGILKALVWPAILIYKLLGYLKI